MVSFPVGREKWAVKRPRLDVPIGARIPPSQKRIQAPDSHGTHVQLLVHEIYPMSELTRKVRHEIAWKRETKPLVLRIMTTENPEMHL